MIVAMHQMTTHSVSTHIMIWIDGYLKNSADSNIHSCHSVESSCENCNLTSKILVDVTYSITVEVIARSWTNSDETKDKAGSPEVVVDVTVVVVVVVVVVLVAVDAKDT